MISSGSMKHSLPRKSWVSEFNIRSTAFGIGLLTKCTVRPAGRLVQVGLLGAELTINNILCVRKRLSILCSYGGKMEDLEDALDLVHKGTLNPQVETGDLDDFPKVLERLHHGAIKSRIALIPKHD